MNPRILAAGLACTLPALALADVSIYGSVRVGINSIKSTDTHYRQTTGVDDYGSKIGFKGREDLGNGLQAIWQLETGMAVDGQPVSGTGSGQLANRMSFVGLEGGWGKLRAGFIDDVLTDTESTDIMASPRRDVNGGIAYPLYEARDIFGSNNYGDSRAKNSLRYDSPRLYGIQGSLQYGAGEKQQDGKSSGDTWGLRLTYADEGYFATYAYLTKLNSIASNNSGVHRLEFGYNANNLSLAATLQKTTLYGNAHKNLDNSDDFEIPGIWETSINRTGNNKLTSQVYALSAAYRMGNFKPMAVYSHRRQVKVDGQSLNWGANQWAIGTEYYLSKTSWLQAGYGQVRQNAGGQRALGLEQPDANTSWLMLRKEF